MVDDDKVLPIDEKEIQNLGTIKVEIHKCQLGIRRIKDFKDKQQKAKKLKTKEDQSLKLASTCVFAEGSKIAKKSHLVGCVDGLNQYL